MTQKTNNSMNKNRIRLTESQLHRVIKESVARILREESIGGIMDKRPYTSTNRAKFRSQDMAKDWKDAEPKWKRDLDKFGGKRMSGGKQIGVWNQMGNDLRKYGNFNTDDDDEYRWPYVNGLPDEEWQRTR